MSNAKRKVVGIIGGMGPQATIDLMNRVVMRTPAADDRDHIHMIVESNPRIPSRIAHLIEGTGKDPTPELIRMARNLEAAGATLLAMPCNTAHYYATAIRAAIGIPMLDMIELTSVRLAKQMPAVRVGLLASTAVLATRLYERALVARGLTISVPTRQADVMGLIRDVKAGESGPAATAALEIIARKLLESSDVLLIGCTELSVLCGAMKLPVPIVDSQDVLADSIIAAALNESPERC